MAETNPYEDYGPQEMTLRDHLAMDRTVLANQRTFLAWIRTALTLFLTGLSLVHFFEHVMVRGLGGALIFAGALVMFLGTVTNLKFKKRLGGLKNLTK